jgi:hypothetical protein
VSLDNRKTGDEQQRPVEIDYRHGIARECVEIDRIADAERNQRRADDPSDLSRPWHSNTFQVMLTCRGRPNIAVTRGNLSPRLLVIAEEKLGCNGLGAKSRRIDGQSGV